MADPRKPTHPDNPAGQVQRIRRARGSWTKHIRPIRKWLIETVQNLPGRQIEVSSSGFSVNRYQYQISAPELDRIVQEIARRMGVEVPAEATWEQVRGAYVDGTRDEVDNLIRITDGDYTREMTEILSSEPWQSRVALIRARVFEEMQGFQGDTADDLARVLRTGVENGLNPRDVADDIRERFDVSRSRANRIARTEITQAYRRARWDEDEDANQRLGIRTRLLWFSALSPTTRDSHAALHGLAKTQDFVRQFYSRDGNSINCKCVQQSVLVDENGSPVNKGFVEEVKSRAK